MKQYQEEDIVIKQKTIVIGHKNPDTDSICSAICYAALKAQITGEEYMAGRAGHVNEETQFVLKYFGVKAPELIKNVKTQVADIEIRDNKGVEQNASLRQAWQLMQNNHFVTLPAVSSSGNLLGVITIGDITRSITFNYGVKYFCENRLYPYLLQHFSNFLINYKNIFERRDYLLTRFCLQTDK